MIRPEIRSLIDRRLDAIEREEDVRVVYACESGSRAWGFESSDSDYDVRFVYVHRTEWYLSFDVERRRDVIERPLESDIDLSGWDLRKTFALFVRSNPPLLEWLVSPIVYRDRHGVRARLQALLPHCYSPAACAHHYLHMARNNYRDFFSRDLVKQKKYFYVLRPLFAVEWIRQGLGPVPMEFDTLVNRLVPAGPLRGEIDELVRLKRSGTEMGLAPRNDLVCEFMYSELERLESDLADMPAPSTKPADKLNRTFRDILADVSAAWEG